MAPYNPPHAHYAHIMLPTDIDTQCMKYVMGKNGANLYNWTKRYNLQYIWIDNKTKKLEKWGSEHAFENDAKLKIENNIKNRIKSYNEKNNTYKTDFMEQRHMYKYFVDKEFENIIDAALPNNSEEIVDCYMKDFYEETVLSEEWKVLTDNEKLEKLDNDIDDYIKGYIEQEIDKFEAL